MVLFIFVFKDIMCLTNDNIEALRSQRPSNQPVKEIYNQVQIVVNSLYGEISLLQSSNYLRFFLMKCCASNILFFNKFAINMSWN